MIDETKTTGKTDTLETLLKEYEKEPKPDGHKKPAPDLTALLKEFTPVIEFAKGEKQRRAMEETLAEVDKALLYLLEADETKGASKRLIRGFLNDYWNENPEFQEIYNNRKKNPDLWTQSLDKARKALIDDLRTLPQSKIRTDIEAAKATVAGLKSAKDKDEGPQLPSNSEMMAMSDQEFRKLKAKLVAAG